jgi:hypothetical protein
MIADAFASLAASSNDSGASITATGFLRPNRLNSFRIIVVFLYS